MAVQEKETWQEKATVLASMDLSWRKIAEVLGKSKSTVSDFLRKQEQFEEKFVPDLSGMFAEDIGDGQDFMDWGEQEYTGGVTHLYIPDSQVKPGVSLDYLEWVGKYIVRKKPDVIVHAGDFADMESLSSYDKGKRTAEGKRVQKDIESSVEGMERLVAPLRELQRQQELAGEEVYRPRMVLTLGNHENRINRHVDANPELHGYMGVDSLQYEEFGWEVIPFLTPIVIDGIAYCHYFPNVMTGKPLGGSALNMLKNIGSSFTQGHKQTLDVATRFLPADGSQQWGIVAGACYTHDEDYKGVQGNRHWRGIIVKHNVNNGSYDPLFIGLDWLEREYGNNS